jgi:hypothetical protein
MKLDLNWSIETNIIDDPYCQNILGKVFRTDRAI